jgi:hypothetical protein
VVGFVMRFHRFFVMVFCMEIVCVRQLSMVRGLLMMSPLRVLCSISVMLGGVLVVLGRLSMMLMSFLVHSISP